MREPKRPALAVFVTVLALRTMKRAAIRCFLLGAASQGCCIEAFFSSDVIGHVQATGRDQTDDRRQEARRSWLTRVGGASPGAIEDETLTRWWRSRRRWAKRQAEKEAAEGRAAASTGRLTSMRKHAPVAIQGLLRLLNRWFGVLVDIATLKRLRLLRHDKQGPWQHGWPIPFGNKGKVQELRREIAAKPGLERRAKRVNHELDNVALGRYLEAAYWSLEHDGMRVSDVIEESIAWRERIGVARLRKEDFVGQADKGTIIVKGHDLDRRPVVYFRPALDGKMEGDGNSKLMIYNLERAIRLMPRNSWQYTIVIDCSGMGLKHLPPVTYLKNMFQLLSHHYPMRLGHVLFTNVGPSVMLCWKVVSPLLQARTKKKMHLITSSNLAHTAKFIHPTQLLDFAGGSSPWKYDPSLYFSGDAASL